ncbi:hypothetical protein AAHE18_01G148500 [Arachis hypogaea]
MYWAATSNQPMLHQIEILTSKQRITNPTLEFVETRERFKERRSTCEVESESAKENEIRSEIESASEVESESAKENEIRSEIESYDWFRSFFCFVRLGLRPKCYRNR